MHIIEALNKVINKKPVLFTTPGHCQEADFLNGLDFLRSAYKYDFSEIEGLDNLQYPEEAILESQKWASKIYGSGHSYYLVNGSSSGILALMLATVKTGEKVLIARNAHKSVINALILTGAEPVWINTEWDNNWNIPTCVTLENIQNIFAANLDIKVVWLTSPTYEGVVTDISPIVQFCREKGLLLIVDEAHGALWNFSDKLPATAISQGVDASVQSLHKTASCLNQGAILHLGKNSKIDPVKVQQSLNIINTTSPSYLILASIEGTIEYLDSISGKNKLDILLENIDNFRKKLTSTEKINFLKNTERFEIDKTKLFFGIKDVPGQVLGDFLLEKFNIEVELDNDKGVLALTGIGTSPNKLEKLSESVIQSVDLLENCTNKTNSFPLIKPEMIYTPKEAFNKNGKKVKLNNLVGKICKETIVMYPPGIPILISGELIRQQHIDLINYRDEIEIIVESDF